VERVHENSFHWLRHGEPTSQRAKTVSSIKIGLRGLAGKFEEKLTQLLFSPE